MFTLLDLFKIQDRTFGPDGPGSPLDPGSPRFPTVPCKHRLDFKSTFSTLLIGSHGFFLLGMVWVLKSNTHLLQGSLLLLAVPSDLVAPGLPAGRKVTHKQVSHAHRQQIQFTDANLA